jgi:vancomycin permeability regulator SanA
LTKSDVIIVLGTAADRFGKPTPVMRERVDEGVRLWKDGYAPYLIFSGTAAHNKFTEAQVMAAFATSRGVKSSAIVLEPQAQNTYQNAFDSVAIMKQRNWKSAIVVSSIAHLRRANYIFSHYPIKYCLDGCNNPPEQSLWSAFRFDQREKLHLLAAIFSGQSASFGLTAEQAAQMKQPPVVPVRAPSATQ